MFKVNEISEDIISSSMKLISLGYNEICLIYFDADTDLLNYIFSDNQDNFSKIRTKLSLKNKSISSLFPLAKFLEEKLGSIHNIEFEKQEQRHFISNTCFEHNGLKVTGHLKDGVLLEASCFFNKSFKNNPYISLDSLFSEISKLKHHSYTYQIMSLFAFENKRPISNSIKSSRMLLIEIEKIKFLVSSLNQLLKQFELKLSSCEKEVRNFISEHLLKENLLNSGTTLFSDNIFEGYASLTFILKKELKILKNILFNQRVNKIELKQFSHPSCIYSKLINGPLSRSAGENRSLNDRKEELFYNQFLNNSPQSNECTTYSHLLQIFFELERSLDICFEILESNNYGQEVYEDYSFYDLNNLSTEVCFQLETGHGLSTVSLYMDDKNKLNFQLISESLRRLYYYQENLKKYDFAVQNNLLECLNIDNSEVF